MNLGLQSEDFPHLIFWNDPVTQLEAYLAQHGPSLNLAGETVQVRHITRRTADSVTAEFLGARHNYLGRCHTPDSQATKPDQSETWELIRIPGRGNVAGRFRVENHQITAA
ncbi:hypothetical protein [Pseudomonas nitroreducens]|uniref:hypothetical protein n=1 Tax=Pseudomonas nitroreducens TaxID=46680 RepID=UPI00190F2EC3|nr:hypothetical protein [Pseudomonas nitroreducens]